MNGDLGGRIALLSLHTSPLDRPGSGDSGGMNVYVREVALGLAARGVEVDVFTRCSGRGADPVQELAPGARVIDVDAGPCSPVRKEDLPEVVPEFTSELLRSVERDGGAYDLVQSHYWLSGLVGRAVTELWRTPLVALFHTLARVKNLSVRDGEAAEPESRAEGEELVARHASRVVVPTATEAGYLSELYGVEQERVRLAPPGVDTTRFRPLEKAAARRRVGLDPGARVALVAGRLQALKAPDVAIRALAEARARGPADAAPLVLAIVGGPSPSAGSHDVARLRSEAEALGVADRVVFVEALDHDEMPWVYSAADVVLMPSRSESFGLVALEAQACGVPVVASSVGGLRHNVVDGKTGFLVPPGDAAALGDGMLAVISDDRTRARMSEAARRRAEGFSWPSTVSRLVRVYAEVRPDVWSVEARQPA
ncbi:MAG TPA: glycosyltransferase [Actinomycetota bacterium]|nr:glycosyltransferase [Actinomycetota bacterium]